MKPDDRLLPLLVCLVFVAACASDREPQASTPAEEGEHSDRVSLSVEAYEVSGISVAPVSSRSLTPIVRVTGTLSYDERRMAVATARVGGRITHVVADYGQRVSKGDALAWVDSPELGAAQAAYRRAWTMARLRQAEYERAQLLLHGEAISRGELLRREADWRAAQAELQTAEQQLHILGHSQSEVEALSGSDSDARHVYPVRAPIDGRVTERRTVPGRVVTADESLFTVAELDSLWLFLQVFEKDLRAVTEGAIVTLTCESHPEERFRGAIDFVGQVLDPHSRTISARAVIDNPEGELKPGMFVYAGIEGRADDPSAAASLALPAKAVASIEGRDVVFVRTAEREFEPRTVVLGRSGGEWVEIRSGLTEGESVAVAGVFTLKSELLKGGLDEHHH